MSKNKDLVINIVGDSKGLQKEFSEIESQTKKLQGNLTSIAKQSTVAFLGLTAAITGTVLAFREDEQAAFRTEQVLKSTGQAAGITAQEVSDLAVALQDVTTFADGAIQAGENLLLTFTNIGAETFPRATEAMLDMATAMGTGLKEAAIQLGKALNDPVLGISSLTRVGVQFTEKQKAAIASMVELNDVAGAQAVILAELEKQMGGAARAAARGTGAFIQLKEVLGNIFSEIGGNIFSVIEPFVIKLRDFFKSIRDSNPELLQWGSNILLAGAALTGLITVLAGLGIGITVISTGLAALGVASLSTAAIVTTAFAGIAGAITLVVKNFDKVEAAIVGVQAGFQLFVEFIVRAINTSIVEINKLQIGFKNLAIATAEAFPTDRFSGFIENLKSTVGVLEEENARLIENNNAVSRSFDEIYDSIRADRAREKLQEQNAVIEEERALANEREIEAIAEQNARKLEEERTFQEEMKQAKLLDAEILKAEKELAILEEELFNEEERERLRQHLESLQEVRLSALNKVQKEEFKNSKKIRDAQRKDEKAELAFKKKFGQDTLNAAAELGGKLLKEGSALQKGLFLVSKVGALADIAINTARAVTLALASAPPPLNFTLAGFTAAAGATQAAAVVSTVLGAQDGALVGDNSNISGLGDRHPFMLERGELVVPRRNFNEVLDSTARSRGFVKSNDESGRQEVDVKISFTDNAAEFLTAEQFENSTLGIDRA